MSQHDMDLANQAGSAFRADLNLAIAAIVNKSSGAAAPATMFAYMWWADTTTGLLKIRNAANSAWISKGPIADAFGVINALLDISGASGGQIQFPATQNASSNANTLDDYEEGTFTPVIQFGGAGVGITYTTQVGRYTKTGNRVTFNTYVLLSAKGSSTGNAKLQALPFTSKNVTAAHCACGAYASALNTITTHGLMFYIAPNESGVSLAYLTGGVVANLTDAIFQNTTEVMAAGSYETD